MSIKPQFVEAILSRTKRYEFRRKIFARPVKTVLIYATAPICRVVAEFDIDFVLNKPITDLWEGTKEHAGIDKGFFLRYFKGQQHGYAIKIGEIRPIQSPYCPIERHGIRPPQSFAYLTDD